MTVAGLTGLTFADLERRLPARYLRWLAQALDDEVAAGRVALNDQGIYTIVTEAFDDRTFAALVALDLDTEAPE